MTKNIEGLEEALDCTLEHLTGEHEGKIVIALDTFDVLYYAAEAYAKIQSGGFVVVPEEATDAMREAAGAAYHRSFDPWGSVYKAMIQAASISDAIERHPSVEELLESGAIKPFADGYSINPGHRVDATKLFELGVPVYTIGGGGGGSANCTLCRAGITHSPYECAGVKFTEITEKMKERARRIQAGEVKGD